MPCSHTTRMVSTLAFVERPAIKRPRGLESVVEKQLKEHNRNLKNVLAYLEEQHNIIICKKTLQNFLKDTGLYLEEGPAVAKKQTQPQ